MAIERVDADKLLARLQPELPNEVLEQRSVIINNLIAHTVYALRRPDGLSLYQHRYYLMQASDLGTIEELRLQLDNADFSGVSDFLHERIAMYLDLLACRRAIYHVVMEEIDPTQKRPELLRQRFRNG